MSAVLTKAYLSPSLVLLAVDWPDGADHTDFLGFAIKRSPGFSDLKTGTQPAFSWLPNRLSFNGPPAKGQPDFPSNEAPIQKFLWWDARLEGVAPGASLTYEVSPVLGTANMHSLDAASTASIAVSLPNHVEFGIGTWFNRAVMASQAFSSKCAALGIQAGQAPTPAQVLDLRTWLANGMELPIPAFIRAASQAPTDSIVGAIYHLTDTLWIIPALKAQMTNIASALVYDSHAQKSTSGKTMPGVNDPAIAALTKVKFLPRDKTKIMHNKFLVAGAGLLKSGATPQRLTQGSANYTTEGLTEQANLVHRFESPDLAQLYFERFTLIKTNPTLGNSSKDAAWSSTVSVGDAGIRVFFSPEPGKPGDDSVSMETIVSAVHGAKSSVIFCLFDPTDALLRDACFSVGDAGKMMFGLVNRIATSEPTTKPTTTGKIPADQLAAVELFHRSRDNKDTIGAQFFSANNLPAGFEPEFNLFPGTKPPPFPPVVVHHKFIVIDAETDSPIIYSGSANMSGNSVFGNDENLLEIKGSARLARIYLAEFLRLYEHYRARAHFIAWKLSGKAPPNAGFALRGDRSWADQHYQPGTPEFKARVHMIDEE
jgi:phosphatidylserine/phosphatidylglycerophosphate/cardiolipin synthase-like enzyme